MKIEITLESYRVNGIDRPLRDDADLRALRDLIDFYLVRGSVHQDAPRASTAYGAAVRDVVVRAPSRKGTGGKRGIDYAVDAARILDASGFSVPQLHDAMISVGWHTESKKRSTRMSQIRELVKDDSRFIKDGFTPGMWHFHEAGMETAV